MIALTTSVAGQKNLCEESLFLKIDSIPDSVTRDPRVFASYLRSVFTADECVAKALYTWLARNMYYDLDMVENPPVYVTPDEIVMKTLENRRGICSNYAEVFREVLSFAGIPVVTVIGYTRSENKVDTRLGHVWNAARIGNKWYLFDATWGGGFVRYERYHKKFTLKYFMPDPDSMITDHMPFDPLWQLSTLPIKHDEFFAGMKTGTEPFAFADSLPAWLDSDTCSRSASVMARCDRFNIGLPQLEHLKTKYYTVLHNDRHNYSVSVFKRSLALINRLSDEYNSLAKGRNSGKLSIVQQKTRLGALQKDLLNCKTAMENRACPDSTILDYDLKMRANFASLEKLIRQISKQIQPSSK